MSSGKKQIIFKKNIKLWKTGARGLGENGGCAIGKASVKKTLHFKEICEELRQVYKHVPKYLGVRFRYTKLAMFYEENNQALYS